MSPTPSPGRACPADDRYPGPNHSRGRGDIMTRSERRLCTFICGRIGRSIPSRLLIDAGSPLLRSAPSGSDRQEDDYALPQ